MAGDFSPLSVDASGGPRHAPPALVVAVAAGLASMDMPIPDVAAWEWQSWKFPRAVRAGETIYARWTLTQKRAPLKSGRTAIAVWRVDVHTSDGTVCAEGEVGASVIRSNRQVSPSLAESPAATGAPAAPARRRRRGRSGGGDQQPAPPAPPPVASQPQQPRSSSSRRRRRRRTGGSNNSSGQSNGGEAPAPKVMAPPPALVEPVAVAPSRQAPDSALTRVMKRLRRTP